jgi:Zn-dependent M16 (insulinase) family peptidase
MRLGTKDKTMEQLEDLIKLKTGGIQTGYHASTSPFDIHTSSEGMVFSGFALDQNVPAMYELLRTVLLETDFDGPEVESKIRQLLQASANGAVNSVAESGSMFACRYAEAGLTCHGRFSEEIGGLTQVQLTASLAGRPRDAGLSDVIDKLKAIQKLVISSSNTLRVALTCGAESVSPNESALKSFLQSLPQPTITPPARQPNLDYRNSKTFSPLPYQVYYTALSFQTVPYMHEDGPPLQILSQLLTHRHLHHEVREKGGAYGAGAYSRGLGGVFGFYSYRDPNPQNTMKILDDVAKWAAEREWTNRDIEEAKLSVFQSIDAPESVSAEGMTRFLEGVDEDMQQSRRERLLDVNANQVKKVAERYLTNGTLHGNRVILGQKDDWLKADFGWSVNDIGIDGS